MDINENRKRLLKKRSTSSFQIVIYGFFLLVFAGGVLLSLPISSQDRTFTPFIDSLFTAVSCTCVTGLVVRDTATHWSLFGQFIILLLIQIGGLGVITIGVTVLKLAGKRIGLAHRSMMQESISAPHIGGIMRLTGFILKTTAIIEGTGAFLLMPVFVRDFGVRGIWLAIFHSVSAFCNAGFDLLGVREQFSSLTTYSDNIYLNIVIMMLIIIGGISFMTWDDVRKNKHHIKAYSLQSKIILFTSGLLILIPAVYFFLFEYKGEAVSNRIIYSLFQSVTTRTAGFNTTDLSKLSEAGVAVMIILMLVGGSPGSTAGGMKTTTLAVLILSAAAVFKRKRDIQCFKRRISEDTTRNAGAILFIYISLCIISAAIISRVESLPLMSCLFETGSAIGTAGLTLGITTSMSMPSKIILMLLMFMGRVGGLTMIYAAVPSNSGENSRLPLERVTVG